MEQTQKTQNQIHTGDSWASMFREHSLSGKIWVVTKLFGGFAIVVLGAILVSIVASEIIKNTF